MESTDFYLTLPSNTGDYPDNTIGDYRVQLPYEVSLDGEWSCALAELIFPVTNLTLHDASIYVTYMEEGQQMTEKIPIPNDHYSHISEVLAAITHAFRTHYEEKIRIISHLFSHKLENDKVKGVLAKLEASKDDLKLEYDSGIRRVKITVTGEMVDVFMNQQMRYILGFTLPTLTKGSHIADSIPDIKGGVNSCFVYTDIVQPQIVGNTIVPLLRVIPLSGPFGQDVSVQFAHLQFARVLTKRFNSIRINISDSGGNTIRFSYGTVYAKLFFKRLSLR